MDALNNLLTPGLKTRRAFANIRNGALSELGERLDSLSKLRVYRESIVASDGVVYFLGRREERKYVGALATGSNRLIGLEGGVQSVPNTENGLVLKVGPTTRENAKEMRKRLDFLNPRPLGLNKSAGLGDRFGLATPGHVRALRAESAANMAPVFAQQSMRENARTGREPIDVIDDAMWGVFQTGWYQPWGADADHLKTFDDVDLCTSTGYTFYTIDPGERVDDRAVFLKGKELEDAFHGLPWKALESSPQELLDGLADREIDLGDESVFLSRDAVVLAAVKYGGAVAHTVAMARRIAQRLGDTPFDLEVSVDETEQVTTLIEHIYIAHELSRLGVRWVSMAPRYVGRFEKGVEYIGDLGELEQDLRGHFRVAQKYGPYKLSLHSGSDKFNVYPLVARVAGELVHLKTAGTSYLEGLRAISLVNPALFRDIVSCALDHYDADRETYHVSADAKLVEASLDQKSISDLLDDFHARQVLHVTFGTILGKKELSEPLFATLKAHEDVHEQVVARHFQRHLKPFS